MLKTVLICHDLCSRAKNFIDVVRVEDQLEQRMVVFSIPLTCPGPRSVVLPVTGRPPFHKIIFQIKT